MAADEEGTIARLRSLHGGVIRPALDRHGGRLVKTMGDGLLVEFPSPVAALRAALEIQAEVAVSERGGAEHIRMRFRVGINLGDVVIDGDDILGDGVNIAARLESLAAPGGICISRAVHDQVRGKTDARLIELGPQQVKNIPDPVEVWRVEADGVAAPPAAVPAATAEAPAIVVLPFDNMSSDGDQAFLADGIVEDVTTELSRFRTLTVIARNSAFAYKGTHRDVREIAGELGVDYVVEGSVRRAGDRLRVTAQLIAAKTGAHVWAERWDRTMADLFEVQDELTGAIVSGVEPELGAHERSLARRKPTASLTAWEMCQRGYHEFFKYTDAGYAAAFDLYRQSIRIDPGFALPRALLARWYWVRIITGRSADVAADLETGIGHARDAIACDDRLEIGHVALGVMLALGGRERAAAEALDRAEALNPNNAMLHFARTHACLYQKAPDAALMERSAMTALRLNPKDPLAWGFWFALANAHRLRDINAWTDEELAAREASCRYENADYYAFVALALGLVHSGEHERAARHLERAMERFPALTAAFWRRAFRFPVWPEWVAATEPELQALIGLGLPEE